MCSSRLAIPVYITVSIISISWSISVLVHFHLACLGNEPFLQELTLFGTLSSNPTFFCSIDPQFSHQQLFYLFLFHNKFSLFNDIDGSKHLHLNRIYFHFFCLFAPMQKDNLKPLKTKNGLDVVLAFLRNNDGLVQVAKS